MSRRIGRRDFLKGAAAILAAAPGCVRYATAPRRKGRPNLLFLMTDEQHHRSLSVTGNPYIQTPHIDRIAREGVLFRNATCVTPYCSPSRASIITGLPSHPAKRQFKGQAAAAAPRRLPEHRMHPPRRRLRDEAPRQVAPGRQGRLPGLRVLGLRLEVAPRFLEKHLPVARFASDKDPGRYLRRPVKKIEAIRRAWKAFHEIPNNHVAYIATIGRTVVPPELLPETQITNQVLTLIEENADRNFMITASWGPPHDLWVTPEPYYSMVDRSKIELHGTRDLPPWDARGPSKRLGDLAGPEGIREYVAIYHGMVKYIDDQVGRILERLDALGLADNTLVSSTTSSASRSRCDSRASSPRARSLTNR